MSASSPAPEPRSAGQLEKIVRRYATAHGLAEKRVRDWIAYMVIGGALERVAADGPRPFTFRGGIALELRRPGTARATKDLDVTYAGAETDLVVAIEEALAWGYERFTFQRTGKPLRMDDVNTVRVDIAVRFDGAPWTTVAIDISPKEPHTLEVEGVPALNLEAMFGIAGPEQIPCLSLRYHLAHKFHGVTAEGDEGQPNERVQDAIDLLLFRQMVTDLSMLRAACVEVFESRDRHRWPPHFNPPPGWAPEFARMAAQVKLDVQDLDKAVVLVRKFIEEIEGSARLGAR